MVQYIRFFIASKYSVVVAVRSISAIRTMVLCSALKRSGNQKMLFLPVMIFNIISKYIIGFGPWKPQIKSTQSLSGSPGTDTETDI